MTSYTSPFTAFDECRAPICPPTFVDIRWFKVCRDGKTYHMQSDKVYMIHNQTLKAFTNLEINREARAGSTRLLSGDDMIVIKQKLHRFDNADAHKDAQINEG